MKKLAILASVFMLCLMLCPVAFADDFKVDYQTDFQEFDKGEIPGEPWTFDTQNKAIGVYAEVDSDPTNTDNRVLRIQSTASEQVVWAKCNFGDIGGKVKIEYKVMLEKDSSQEVLYPGAFDSGLISNLMTYQGAWVLGANGLPNIAPTTMTWHAVCFDIDFSEHRFTLTINNDVILDNYPLNSADVESISRIKFGYGRFYILIDDLKVSHAGNIEKSYTKIAADGYHYNTTLKGLYNIPYETEIDDFLNNITFVDGAVYGVYESDGETPYTKPFIEEHSILKIQSPDLKQDLRLELHVRPWISSIETARIAKDCVLAFDGSPYISIKNKKERIDEQNKEVKSFIEDSKLFVPLRKIAEELGAKVDYDSITQKVTINGKTVESKLVNLSGHSFIAAEALADILGQPLLISEKDMAVFSKTGEMPEKHLIPKFISELYDRR